MFLPVVLLYRSRLHGVRMEKLRAPAAIQFGVPHLAEAWRKWKKQFRTYHTAAKLSKKDPATQVAILLNVAGPEAQEIFDTFTFGEGEDQGDLDTVLRKFEEYCNPRKNTVFERHQFWSRDQQEGETIDQWLTDLRTRASVCEFGDQKDLLIRDKIVFGIQDDRVKERLLRETNLTLTSATAICRAAEASCHQAKAMAKEATPVDVKMISRRQHQHTQLCKYCGHPPRQCPAYGTICSHCHAKNHFASVCMKRQQLPKQHAKRIHAIQTGDVEDGSVDLQEEEEDSLFVGALQKAHQKNTGDWTENIAIGQATIRFKLDTGADANIIPYKALATLNKQDKQRAIKTPLRPTNNLLVGIGDGKIRPRGVVHLDCTVARRQSGPTTIAFYVIDDNLAILGRQACEALDLIKRVDSISHRLDTKQQLQEAYKDVFEGIGCYQREYDLQLRDDVTLVIQVSRTIPYAKQQKLKDTLTKLEEQDIIAPVREPTGWVHNLVITEKKNGSMRICLDPRPLNTAIKREHHHIATARDVQARLAGKQLVTVVDMRDAFWHVKLSESSSYLCTFHTPWGRKRFKRMPFGLSSASEVLQQRNEETFGDIPNVFIVADDIIIAGSDESEHDKALHAVMQRAHVQR